ncbi:hypothetical protein BDZ89DRAFT_1148848 [Hymenopellis radicata]|nr:hypothetical protein BDZ89DRAFT_1148848 [Hymenopellis radicata]
MPPDRTKPAKARKYTYKKKPKEGAFEPQGVDGGQSREDVFAARDRLSGLLQEWRTCNDHHFGHLEDHEDPEHLTAYDALKPKINNDANVDPVVLEAARKKVLFNNETANVQLLDGPSVRKQGKEKKSKGEDVYHVLALRLAGLDKAPKQPHAAHVGAGRGREEQAAQSGEGAREDAATVEGGSKDVHEDSTTMDTMDASKDASKDAHEDNTTMDASKDDEVAVSRVEEETEPVPLSVRDKVMRDLFKQQPAAVQEKYKEMAKVEGDQAKAEHKRQVREWSP